MSKKKLPKRRKGICKKCGTKFSYLPKHSYDIKNTCDKHRATFFGTFSFGKKKLLEYSRTFT